MAQSSFSLFFSVVVLMAVCMAWKVDQGDIDDRKAAEDWLKKEDIMAYHLRESIIKKHGAPASSIRPEGNATWVFFGLVAALSFILLNWHNWEKLPPSNSGSLLILLNLLIILFSTLILHIGFFGRVIALYKRNFKRVEFLTKLVEDLSEKKMDAWWNCRNFVLNEDLCLDYDIGGLAVSATFLITVGVFCVLASQCYIDGADAMREAPGSYCAYASLYLCTCLIHIFTLATTTFEEQQRHILGLQKKSLVLLKRGASQANLAPQSDWEYGAALEEREQQDLVVQRASGDTKSTGQSFDDTDLQADIESSSSMDVDDLQHVYFYESEKKHTNSRAPPVNPNLINTSANETLGGGAGVGVGGFKHLISTIANSASSSALFGSGSTPKNSSSSSTATTSTMNDMDETVGLLAGDDTNPTSLPSTNSNSSPPTLPALPVSVLSASGSASNSIPPPPLTSSSSSGSDAGAGTTSTTSTAAGTSTAAAGGTDAGSNSQPVPRSPSRHSQRGKSQIQRLMIDSMAAVSNSALNKLGSSTSNSIGMPTLSRTMSMRGTMEASRSALAAMISQIQDLDPKPCIFGIPVMPALFRYSKFYLFLFFAIVGCRSVIEVLHDIL